MLIDAQGKIQNSYGTVDSAFNNPAAWHLSSWSAGDTTTGVAVTPESSMQLNAIQSCVRVLAESVACLPLITYRRRGETKSRFNNHPLYSLLHDRPNDDMTAFTWRESMMANLALWGNAYAEIERDGAGRVQAIHHIPAWLVVPRRAENMTVFDVSVPGEGTPVRLPSWKVLHIPGLSFDGLLGRSPIAWARESISTGIAAEKYSASFFATGGHPKDVLEFPGKLDKTAATVLRESWESGHGSLSKAQRTAILQNGVKYTPVHSIPMKDAQYVELRQFQAADIARIFRVPPHLINEMGRATWGNTELMDLSFVKHTLRPWLVRIEQALAWKLLTERERRSVYFEHLVDALLRGDIKSRYDAYAVGRMWGWLSINDVRRRENMDPIEHGDGYMHPLNMTTVGEKVQKTGMHDTSQTLSASADMPALPEPVDLSPVAAAAAERIVSREHADIERQRGKRAMQDADAFAAWLGEYITGDHADWVTEQLLPLLTAQGIPGAAGDIAARWCDYVQESVSAGHAPAAQDLLLLIDEVTA
jgi:HK97 family phage portal protein